MGLIARLIGGLISEFFLVLRGGFGVFPALVEILLVGGFVYFILTRYWWKKEVPAPVEEPKPDIPPVNDGKIRPL